jgi:dihydropteroate synthase
MTGPRPSLPLPAWNPGRFDSPAPRRLAPTRIGGRVFAWGVRTFVMGIVNVTPDSFSGDGILAPGAGAGAGAGAVVEAAVAQARRMVEEGADILDVGGESTRPGHSPVPASEERGRVIPVIGAIHAALPDIPISVDTSKAEVAAGALDAGASLLNDVWGTGPDDAMARLAGERRVPLVVMHNRAEARYGDFLVEMLADLTSALDRARKLGVPPENLIVDPGFGFGKTPEHNLEVMRHLAELRALGHPVLLGTSRKSTLGRVLGGVPAEDRLEATLATTALGIAGGVDVVRVHDVLANVRAARMADAIVRGEAQ